MAKLGRAAADSGRPRIAHLASGAARWSAAAARQCAATARSAAATWGRATLDLVFPRACIGCHEQLPDGDPGASIHPFCGDCWEQFHFLAAPLCRRCGAPLPRSRGNPEAPGCFRCDGRKLWIEETVAAGLYDGLLRELVLRMKRSTGDALSLAVGEMVWQQCGERLSRLEVDVVVPIPLHWRRRLAHRTNSSTILAEVLSGRLGVPLSEGMLRRRRATRRQSELSPPQRWENVRRAFSVKAGYHLRRARVLVVDDILTTGATCSEAARTLRRAGAERVTAVVAARAIGQGGW